MLLVRQENSMLQSVLRQKFGKVTVLKPALNQRHDILTLELTLICDI